MASIAISLARNPGSSCLVAYQSRSSRRSLVPLATHWQLTLTPIEYEPEERGMDESSELLQLFWIEPNHVVT